jgi:hypothetical protein
MSASNTDVEKQVKRHKGPLIGIALVVAFALILLAFFAARTVDQGGVPEGADVQVDGRTGAAVDTGN